MLRWSLLWLGASAGCAHAQPTDIAAPLQIDCAHSHDVVTLPTTPLPLAIAAPNGAWLTLTERGQDIDVDRLDAAASVQTPPRLGLRAFDVRGDQVLTIRRVRAGSGAGAVDIRLDCDIAAGRSVADWLRAVSPVALRVAAPADDVDTLLRDIDALVAAAPHPPQRARGLHLRAQALFANGRSADAVGAFAVAEDAWLAASMIEPALAARVGRVEDAIRAARYDDALSLARSFPAKAPRDSYFAVRLNASICLAEHYLAHLDAAVACYRRVIARLDALGEKLEAAANRIDLAALQRERGLVAASERSLRVAIAAATGPQSDTLRGRAHLGLVDVDLARGDLGMALQDADAAIDAFEQAKQPRWQATTLLKLADVYVELEAGAEARALIERALARFDAANAPSRIAAARAMRARVLALDGDRARALDDLDAAASAYRSLKMPVEYQSTQLARVSLLLRLGDAAAAELAFDAIRDSVDDEAVLAGAEIDLHVGRIESARARLERLRGKPLRLSAAGEWVRLDAAVAAADGNLDSALDRLLAHVLTLRRLAAVTHNRLFGELLMSRQRSIREAAVDMLAQTPAKAMIEYRRGERLWAFVEGRRGVVAGHAEQRGVSAEALDRALSREFLARATGAGAHAEPADFRALLSLLRDRSGTRAQVAPALSLPAMQARLRQGMALIAFVEGRQYALRLLLTSDRVRVDRIAPAQAAIGRLRAAAADPQVDLSTIEAAARNVEQLLFDGLADVPLPSQLVVLADSYGGAVPWNVLRWPGQEAMLGAGANLAVAEFAPERSDHGASGGAPSAIDVLVAARYGGAPLAELPVAGAEFGLVANNAGSRRTVTQLAPTRASVLAALRKSGGWVHIAAHGRGGDDRIGGSGLWLQAQDAAAPPDYLSGIDVMAGRVGAALVVLNACDIGGAARATEPANKDFARALIRSGATHVVAAQWPISDASALTWVPAFYRQLDSSGGSDVGSALAAARREMMRSPMFRHPFYWASLVHYRAVP